MSDTQWVQHISGQGEKYEVNDEHTHYLKAIAWQVYNQGGAGGYFYLPKSEYLPCSPPERWEVVPIECEVFDNGGSLTFPGLYDVIKCRDNTRFAIRDGALVLERKVPQ